MTDEEEQIQARAITFAKANKTQIARKLTCKEEYPRSPVATSVFMAGSPGAGKTETATEMAAMAMSKGAPSIHIDTDAMRPYFSEYNGANSWLFQYPASILVDKIHDLALKNGQNFFFDSTFSNFERAKKNIARSIRKNRVVIILYVYLDPKVAWNFVLKREKAEGRNIPKESFIEQYFNAKDTVNRIKQEFGKKIIVELLHKKEDFSPKSTKFNIDQIDNHIGEKYTRAGLLELLPSNYT
ncbi:zeta toxin family protein [Microbulbifer elongatus]|uniref:zeta toxin family protein n=1 Tax=Microbulbifer elongatus TaxID=86173 RepID=UPI001CFED12D|nr:zeta toxin family protein [Microbulbifer elongatus]